MAQLYKEKISDKLKGMVDHQARLNFNEYLSEGNKLTYLQLRKLNSVWKKDYVGHMMEESEVMRQYVE